MSLLEIAHLCYSASSASLTGLRARPRAVLHDISIVLEEGKTLGLVGPSGEGKTTLAKCVAGLLAPQEGTIAFRGRNIHPEVKNRKALGPAIQMLFQGGGSSLDPLMLIGESLAEAARVRRRGNSTGMRELVHSVGLPERVLQKYPPQLSGGEQQRVALARALAVAPELLILDEPTSALDSLTQEQVLAIVKELQSEHGYSLLCITHDVPLALRFCDRIALMYGGRIIEEGTCAGILTRPAHPLTKQLLLDCKVLLPMGSSGAEPLPPRKSKPRGGNQ